MRQASRSASECAKRFVVVPAPSADAPLVFGDPPADMAISCVDYRATLVKAAGCAKLPAATRLAMQEMWAELVAHWTSAPDEREALVGECKSGNLAIEHSEQCR